LTVYATKALVAARTSNKRVTSGAAADADDAQAARVTSDTDTSDGPVAQATSADRGEPVGLGARVRDADSQAVASFVLGLVGLLAFNLVLGPCALVLGGLALKRGTTRPGRAVLGLALGAADLIVLAAVTAADHSVSWSLAG
jgi:hypothetical protein